MRKKTEKHLGANWAMSVCFPLNRPGWHIIPLNPEAADAAAPLSTAVLPRSANSFFTRFSCSSRPHLHYSPPFTWVLVMFLRLLSGKWRQWQEAAHSNPRTEWLWRMGVWPEEKQTAFSILQSMKPYVLLGSTKLDLIAGGSKQSKFTQLKNPWENIHMMHSSGYCLVRNIN